MGGMSNKELDARLRALQHAMAEEEEDLAEEQRKLFDFEDKFLRDTLLEGNILMGWGEPRSAPVRFRNAALRKKKRERQEAAGGAKGKAATAVPPLTVDEQDKVDRHRLASFSSVLSPAEPIRQRLEASSASHQPDEQPTPSKKAKKAATK